MKLRQSIVYIRPDGDTKEGSGSVSHKGGGDTKHVSTEKQNKKQSEWKQNEIGVQDGAVHTRSEHDTNEDQRLCAEMVRTLRDSCNVDAVADVILTTASANPSSDIEKWMREGDSGYWQHQAEVLRGIRPKGTTDGRTETDLHAHDSEEGLNEGRIRVLLDRLDAYLMGVDACARAIAAAREGAVESLRRLQEKRAVALARHMRRVTIP
jgi:hypothetical protein